MDQALKHSVEKFKKDSVSVSCGRNADLCKKRKYLAFIADRVNVLYTAISRKVFGKSARDNPERYCGWF